MLGRLGLKLHPDKTRVVKDIISPTIYVLTIVGTIVVVVVQSKL
jgi:hypothetical protein